MVACALLLPAILYEGSRTSAFAQILAGLSIALFCVHATTFLGIVCAFAFIFLCLTVTIRIENIGVATGIPFGLL
ncbi:hypothetical protein MPAR168_18705 [Methylorubrum populi]|uniref:Uncharacterized protein n=1 Tax=Methylobacterium radiotolerans TaxID=31998 RepID=A0ABU7T5N0_9HYPH